VRAFGDGNWIGLMWIKDVVLGEGRKRRLSSDHMLIVSSTLYSVLVVSKILRLWRMLDDTGGSKES